MRKVVISKFLVSNLDLKMTPKVIIVYSVSEVSAETLGQCKYPS